MVEDPFEVNVCHPSIDDRGLGKFVPYCAIIWGMGTYWLAHPQNVKVYTDRMHILFTEAGSGRSVILNGEFGLTYLTQQEYESIKDRVDGGRSMLKALQSRDDFLSSNVKLP